MIAFDANFERTMPQLWHGVVTTAASGVATQYAFDSQVQALQWSVLLQRLNSVLRTSGRKAASWRQHGRNITLIEAYGQYEQACYHGNAMFSLIRRNATSMRALTMCDGTGRSDSHIKAMCSALSLGNASTSWCFCKRYASRSWRLARLRSTACLKWRFDTLSNTLACGPLPA